MILFTEKIHARENPYLKQIATSKGDDDDWKIDMEQVDDVCVLGIEPV